MIILKSFALFIVAGLCEIAGGYLIWQWLKESKPVYYGICGGFLLFFYGVAATFQSSNFARVYAAYGGVFIIMSLVWAYRVDSYLPDKYDIIGALVALIGVGIIIYTPRTG